MIKFEVGKIYIVTTLYGGLARYLCISRTDTTVTLDEVGYRDAVETYDIEINDECEVILYWEYKDHKCYISAYIQ